MALKIALFREYIDMYGNDKKDIIEGFYASFLIHNERQKIDMMEMCRDISKDYAVDSKENIMLSMIWYVLRKSLNIRLKEISDDTGNLIRNIESLVELYEQKTNNSQMMKKREIINNSNTI